MVTQFAQGHQEFSLISSSQISFPCSHRFLKSGGPWYRVHVSVPMVGPASQCLGTEDLTEGLSSEPASLASALHCDPFSLCVLGGNRYS